MVDMSAVRDRSTRLQASAASGPTGTLGPDAALRMLNEARYSLCTAVAAADHVALTEVLIQHPRLGPLNAYHWVQFAAAHEGRHREQLRELADALAQDRDSRPTPRDTRFG
jgi:hypothetical protein